MVNDYVPWCNDWMCKQCKTCNTGSNKTCTGCGTPMPAEVWMNLKSPKQERKYCKICGRRKQIKPTEKKKPMKQDFSDHPILKSLVPFEFPRSS